MEKSARVVTTYLFAGLKGHIFVSVPLLLYLLSAVSGKIVFFFLFFAFQLHTFVLLSAAFFFPRSDPSPLWTRCIRCVVALSWGGICFLVYAMLGSLLYASLPRPTKPHPLKAEKLAVLTLPPAAPPAITVDRRPPHDSIST